MAEGSTAADTSDEQSAPPAPARSGVDSVPDAGSPLGVIATALLVLSAAIVASRIRRRSANRA